MLPLICSVPVTAADMQCLSHCCWYAVSQSLLLICSVPNAAADMQCPNHCCWYAVFLMLHRGACDPSMIGESLWFLSLNPAITTWESGTHTPFPCDAQCMNITADVTVIPHRNSFSLREFVCITERNVSWIKESEIVNILEFVRNSCDTCRAVLPNSTRILCIFIF